MSLDPAVVEDAVRRALSEDVGAGDITTNAIVPPHAAGIGVLVANEECVLCGVDVAREVFRALGGCTFPGDARDGDVLKAGDRIDLVVGSLRSILTGERVALNFLQSLSGVATTARRCAEASPGVQVRDTRKTVPGLRALQKHAVAVGGGVNHRFGLYDAVLVKDNHIAAAGSLAEAVGRVRAAGHRPVQVECDTLEQVREALDAGADGALLDNMSPDTVRTAVEIVDCAMFLEASGGITFETLPAYAATGVDAVSLGALTHSVRAIDLSLEVRPE